MDERYYTVDTKDHNFIVGAPSKLSLTIDLSDEEFTTSYFGRYESIALVRDGKEYAFTLEEFVDGMNRMAHTVTEAKCSWQDDTLHVELPELPKEVRVTLPDRRGGNRVRSARVWAYVPERTATRRIRSRDGIGRCACSECGGSVGTSDRYCKHCRAEFVGDEYEGRSDGLG